MQGIVTLLDPEHYALTEALWAELAEVLHLRGAYVTPYPHFSYHVAADYDRGQLYAVLDWAAAAARPLAVTTAGLGVFTGPAPVLYISVVRTAELGAFHARLWSAVEATASGGQPYYAPANWMPHITLGHLDLTPDTLGEALRRLGGRSYNWEIPVTNLAHIDDAGGQQRVAKTVKLSA
jgi:2'-5' RNA ligase